MNSLPEGIALFDLEGNCFYFNESILEIFEEYE